MCWFNRWDVSGCCSGCRRVDAQVALVGSEDGSMLEVAGMSQVVVWSGSDAMVQFVAIERVAEWLEFDLMLQ